MRTLKILGIIIALSSTQVSAQVMVMGQGTFSCGAWTEARKTKNPLQYSLMQWVFGFLSGANVGHVGENLVTPFGPDFLKDTDLDAVTGWMDNYCRNNPLHQIGTAAIALEAELRARVQPR